MDKRAPITILIIIILSFIVSGCENEESMCGNGIQEEGEGYSNCCEDAGCQIGKICVNNECILKVSCNQCQYEEDGVCKDYLCCINMDCDDNNISTKDECIGGFTKQAKCKYTLENLCISGDNLCPAGCNQNNDSDCESSIIDCGKLIEYSNLELYDCLIEAAENCYLSKLNNINTMNLFGLIITTETDMEIRGMESNKCIYSQKTINQTINFSDEYMQQLIDEGKTQEEIDQQLQISNHYAKLAWGLEKVCKFDKTDLVILLNHQKENEYNDTDWEAGECTDNQEQLLKNFCPLADVELGESIGVLKGDDLVTINIVEILEDEAVIFSINGTSVEIEKLENKTINQINIKNVNVIENKVFFEYCVF